MTSSAIVTRALTEEDVRLSRVSVCTAGDYGRANACQGQVFFCHERAGIDVAETRKSAAERMRMKPRWDETCGSRAFENRFAARGEMLAGTWSAVFQCHPAGSQRHQNDHGIGRDGVDLRAVANFRGVSDLCRLRLASLGARWPLACGA